MNYKLPLSLLLTLTLTACETIINAPEDYLRQVLADAINCQKESLAITNEYYEYPSTIYTVNCAGKISKCREQRYGYDLYSGHMSSKMICIPDYD